MTTSFLLLEPSRGRRDEVAAVLAGMPEVRASERLFGEQFAVRVEGPEDVLDAALDQLGGLEAVAWAAAYTPSGSGVDRRTLKASR